MAAISEKDLPPEARARLKKQHNTQNIKTFYDENEKRETGLKHHADRVASNRKQRDDARAKRPLREKIHDTLGRGGAKVKAFAEPIINDIRTTAREPRGGSGPLVNLAPVSSFGFPQINPMSMGMNSPGIAGPPAWMMGGGQPEPAPRRRPKKRKRRSDDYEEPRAPRRKQASYSDLGGIPPEVKRWMF
jgi:hypothetical protein